jgi:hypothetical protein
VYGISAKQAIEGKLTGDMTLLERSRFLEFEKSLEHFLTEERGMILLQVPLNRVVAGALEVLKTIELRENALRMKKEEFEAKYQESIVEIENIRKKKREELDRLTSAAEVSFRNLQPFIDSFWLDVTATAESIVHSSVITGDDIKRENIEATQQRLSEKISYTVSIKAQDFAERIQVEIERDIATDIGKSATFGQYLAESMGSIHYKFTDGSLKKDELAIASAISWIPGGGALFGGAYIGYNHAGLKGALVGGAVSMTGKIITSYALLSIVGLVFPITLPVTLVVGIGAAVASAFSSKLVLDTFLGNDAVPKFRESFIEAVRGQLNGIQKGGDFVEQIRLQVFNAYDQIKENVERDTETVLRDTEQTLASIKDQLMVDKVSSEHEKERLAAIAAECRDMLSEAERLNNMLLEIDEKGRKKLLYYQ